MDLLQVGQAVIQIAKTMGVKTANVVRDRLVFPYFSYKAFSQELKPFENQSYPQRGHGRVEISVRKYGGRSRPHRRRDEIDKGGSFKTWLARTRIADMGFLYPRCGSQASFRNLSWV